MVASVSYVSVISFAIPHEENRVDNVKKHCDGFSYEGSYSRFSNARYF